MNLRFASFLAGCLIAAGTAGLNPALAKTYQSPLSNQNDVSFFLYPDDSIVSEDGRFTLLYQKDGNLVLREGDTFLWASNTYIGGNHSGADYGYDPRYAKFQGDGNFVIYHGFLDAPAADRAVWSTKTYKYSNSTLTIQNDGNIVIRSSDGKPKWASNTCCH